MQTLSENRKRENTPQFIFEAIKFEVPKSERSITRKAKLQTNFTHELRFKKKIKQNIRKWTAEKT